MKSTTKNRIFSLLLAFSVFISIIPFSAYATNTEQNEIISVEETNEDSTRDETEETKNIGASEETLVDENVTTENDDEFAKFDWDLSYDKKMGYIDGNKYTTEQDGVYSLTLSADVIKELDENCYIYLVETNHNNIKIRIDLSKDDNFAKTVYLPEGYYQIVETGVVNAPTLTFRATTTAINLGDENVSDAKIQIILNNAEEVSKNLLGVWEDKSSVKQAAQNLSVRIFGIEHLKGVQSSVNGVLYYSTTHTGPKKIKIVEKEVEVLKDGQKIIEIQQVEEPYYEEPGLGYAAAYGNAIADKDIVLKIIKGGVVGQAEFKVSYDGGLTYFSRYYTGESVVDTNIGLTYHFYTLNDNDEFTEGDEFTFHSIESFEVGNSSNENSRIVCVGHPTEKHELVVSILSSGGRGISRVKIEDKNKNLETKTYLIPDNGILELDDNLTIYFENLDGYVKGVEYKIAITSHDATINYMPLITLGICVAILLIAILVWLLMKKEKRGDYIIHQYEWKQDESVYK